MKNNLSLFRKNVVLKGTVILTLSGILSRIMGFYYRIFLSNLVGSVGVGLIQLVIPLGVLSFALCSAGIQTAISRYTAAAKNTTAWMLAGTAICVPLSVIFALLLYFNAPYIASGIFLNNACTPLIKVISVSIPFSAIHNCFNGYYYGKKEAFIPASSQLIEQFFRIFSIFIYCKIFVTDTTAIPVSYALIGNILGEMAACLYCFTFFCLRKKNTESKQPVDIGKIKIIFKYSFPITINRTLMHFLEGAEAILIPTMLCLYGLTDSEALSVYGILAGMALPLIMFPSAITNSFSVMLLPKISEEYTCKKHHTITNTIEKTITLCMHLGIMSTLLFMQLGGNIGAIIFHEQNVYYYCLILSWLCPFLYLKATLTSILNGLDLTGKTCIINIVGIIIRIVSIIIIVPRIGINGYLYGMLFSNILVCILLYLEIFKRYKISFSPLNNLLIPLCISIISITGSKIFNMLFENIIKAGHLTALLINAFLACIIYIIILINHIDFKAE